MIYRSNLVAPDLTPQFRFLHSRVMGHSFGHDVLSDWADKADTDPLFGLYKKCGFWTHDEAAILYNIGHRIWGLWADIGSHTGWTAAHILASHAVEVVSASGPCPTCELVDPLYAVDEFRVRAALNMAGECGLRLKAMTAAQFFDSDPRLFDGIVIDGDHEPGEPMRDARAALLHLTPEGVILFHDFVGLPVREAVLYLMRQGMKVKLYLTPHVVACCWRSQKVGASLPKHIPDPVIRALRLWERWPEWDWEKYFA